MKTNVRIVSGGHANTTTVTVDGQPVNYVQKVEIDPISLEDPIVTARITVLARVDIKAQAEINK